MNKNLIRNFSIIAHIDHGKSTIADRILEKTGAISNRDMRSQYLDSMDIERERGITIKSQTARLRYISSDEKEYVFNLIDTPGHVDFNYEVSRSLSASEGALLIIDASQGIEAQTLANFYMALENNLFIVPVLNKIDLPNADIEKVLNELEEVLGINRKDAVLVSGKTGCGIDKLLEAIVEKIPYPSGISESALRCLIIDSWFDTHKGVVALVRVFDGTVSVGQKILLMHSGKKFTVIEVGYFSPFIIKKDTLSAGDVGFVIANIKIISDAKIGDTITSLDNSAKTPLPGFLEVKPVVFAGIFPIDSVDYESLGDSILKLSLNDSSFTFQPESSKSLGFGFRCGFLGLLHMEITRERIEREFNLSVITTPPTVIYKVKLASGDMVELDNPSQLRDFSGVSYIEEPYIKLRIHSPDKYIGTIISLCEEKRGTQVSIFYPMPACVQIEYMVPFAEIMFDFFDKLKSISKGYASMDYDFDHYECSKLVRVDILLNGEVMDVLSFIAHADSAQRRGRELCEKMKNEIPRQQYQVAIQAAIGGKIIARETISALRKDVTAKCYGGDISRKRKLLEKQKEGKKKMKKIGKISIPQSVFVNILKLSE